MQIDQTKAKEVEKALKFAFLQTNNDLLKSNINCTFSGTTVIGVLVLDDKHYSANVGDSRAVLVKFDEKTSSWRCAPLSIDHKPDEEDEKKRIEANGGRVDPYYDNKGKPMGPARVWLKS